MPRQPRATSDAPIVIVGAGPAGLACATVLACHHRTRQLRILDPSGTWLSDWRRRFAQQAIPTLRSPAVHHPHPDPFALLGAGDREGLVRSGGTYLPTPARFEAFVAELTRHLDLVDRVEPRRALALDLDAEGRPTLELSDGTRLHADRVVVATNTRRAVVPAALRDLVGDPRVATGEQADVRTAPEARITIVGGGLSAAHLAIGAAKRGATVTMLARRRLTVRRFDVHPSWLGPRKLRPFAAEADPVVRRRAIEVARGGGSIPPPIHARLRGCVEAGRLELRERVALVGADAHDAALVLHLDDGATIETDRLWLATGGRVDVCADPLVAGLARRTVVAGGLPELAADLTVPGTRVHLAGATTGLRLGPTAGNLIGHRRAAARIAAAVRGEDPDRADRIETGAGACPGLPRW